MNIPDPARWARLSPLLDDLLDLPKAERALRLAAVRGELPDLADELATLLAGDGLAASQRFLTGALTPPGGLDVWPGPGLEASLAGQRLGAYVLETPLGQGGGGSVWRARREDGRFDGAVAIKLLHLSLVGRAGAERFRREGQILARLTHPHIAHLLDAGVTPAGQPYLVLELVQGERIDRHCDARRLGVAARLALFEDVLSAVAHAHTHGVIHRDLKPGNILVSADGVVKLLDFGIAKLLDDETDGPGGAEATALTREGGRALTPEYAAPEQLRGEGVTTATDVYALGVLLYLLLVGRHPTAPLVGSAAEVMRSTLEVEPPRLSRSVSLTAADAPAAASAAELRSTTPQRLQRSLAGDLDTIVAHALRKLPAERYATVAALADDLARHRQHQPVLARRDSWAYRARKFVRRNRGLVGAACVVSLVVVLGVLSTLNQARRAEREKLLALHQLAMAEATGDLLKFLVGSATGTSLTAAGLLARAEALADKQFSDTPAARAHVLLQLADLWSDLGNGARAAGLAGRAQQAAQAARDLPSQLRADCVLASAAVARGDFAAAQLRIDAAFSQATGLDSAAASAAQDALLGCLLQRAAIAREQARPAAVLADLDQALRLLPQPRLGQWQTVVSLRSLRAGAYAEQGRLAAASAEYEAMLADVDRTGRAGLVTNINALNDAGAELLRVGQIRKALDVLGRGYAISLAAGARDEVDLSTEANYARALFEAGRHTEAMPLFAHALSVGRRLNDARVVGNVALVAAVAHAEAGELPRAEALINTSAENLASFLPPDHPLFAQVQMVRSRLALAAGQPQRARAHLQQAMQRLASGVGNQARRVSPLILQARIALQLGELDAALTQATDAADVARLQLGDLPSSAYLGQALRVLGQAQQARGDVPAARASLGQALVQFESAVGPGSPPADEARRLLAGL